jgi:hypothetical protein
MSRDIEDLTPELQVKCEKFQNACEEAGIPVMIIETLRIRLTQNAYYAQGREQLSIVNAMRKRAGLWPITAEENERVITWTLESDHFADKDGKSHAFDVALIRNGRPHWDLKCDVNEDDIPDYEQIGEIGKSVGLKWGGDWKKPDRPHFYI